MSVSAWVYSIDAITKDDISIIITGPNNEGY